MGKPAVVQSVSSDPKELFDPSTYPTPTYLGQRYLAVTGAVSGLLLRVIENHGFNRPYLSGLPQYALYMLGGFALGVYFHRRNELYWAEKDAIMRHYTELHPEDFAYKRVLVGDMFKPWNPIR